MNVTGLLLAGGRSRRLGKDKRFLEFRGQPLILRAYEAASAIAEEIWVLLADPQDEPRIRETLRARPLRFVFDQEPGAGPLGALAGALPRIRSDYALLMAVDYPFITGSFLRSLRAHLEAQPQKPDVLVPIWQGIPQVTCAFYRCSLREELQEALNSGERSLRRFVEGLPPGRLAHVEEAVWRTWGPPHVFQSVNTPEDYERLLRARASGDP